MKVRTSSSFSRRSASRISASWPRARHRWIGRTGSMRVPIMTCAVAGSRSTKVASPPSAEWIDDVQVVEDEPRGAGPKSHLVDQRGHDVSDIVGTLYEEVERIGGASWLDGRKRSSNGRPEPEFVMIPPVAREPSAPSPRSLCDPGRQQHGLPSAWAACDQGAGKFRDRIQPVEKVRPWDQGVRQGGSDELRHSRFGTDHQRQSTKPVLRITRARVTTCVAAQITMTRANGTNHVRDYLQRRGRTGRVGGVRGSRCLD